MIEMAWYLTSNENENVALYLNLRGDGLKCERQLRVLSQISSVMVILIDICQLADSQSKDVIKDLIKCTNGIVLGIDAHSKSKTDVRSICQKYLRDIGDDRTKTRICILAVNETINSFSLIKKDIAKGITESLQDASVISLRKHVNKGNGTFFTTDEDSPKFKKAKQKALDVTTHIPNECANVKEHVIPLQGQLWRRYSETQKAAIQSSKYELVQDADKKNDELRKQRQKQIDALKNQGILMATFLTILLERKQTDEECILFITQLKLVLDDRSRSVLPESLHRYQMAWHALKADRDNKEASSESLKEKFKEAEYNLADASFGFEHLVRECGQTFEAVMEFRDEISDNFKTMATDLSRICAKMLLLGQPIELMDGDAANVPLKWVKAVLNELKKLIGDKKLLTLSVLGIQSSGKSTLLNTMLGLQFAVSAGRCTRGVFIQLVPVEKDDFKFDYVLVVDSEGLRATELGHQKNDHDNKLATFVIGLGDITIINIKGENTAEMKDILQIAVHAFLRLKLVNERLNLKQSCVFVHQNVPATDANDKMMQGRQKLVEKLDQMTKEAASQEKITNIRSFDQVIDFDSEKNVWYFSDLWVGDPPMAPSNPGYSKNAAEVKLAILTKLASDRDTYLTLSNTMLRIEDLWRGILSDDFVFGFRNSLEFKAYSNMEKRYQEVSFAMHKFFLEFVQLKAKQSLESSTDVDDLMVKVDRMKQSLREEAEENVNSLSSNLESFVKENELKDVMTPWVQTKNVRLKILKDSLLTSTEKDILNIREEKKIQIMQIKEKTKHEIDINDRARQLANELKGKKVDAQKMMQSFENMWLDWLKKFYSSVENIDYSRSVREQIESLVWDQFPEMANYLKTEQNAYQNECMTCLVGSLTPDDFQIGKHLEIHKRMIRKVVETLMQQKESHNKYKEYAVEVSNKIFRRIDIKLREITSQDTRFNVKYVTDIISIIVEVIDDHNEKKSETLKFNLLHPYNALIIHHVVRYITIVFTNKEDDYNRRHSLIGQLEEYKGTAWELFKNVVEKNTEDIIAASFFQKVLEKSVIDHVSGLMPVHIQELMMSKFCYQKQRIINDVMRYLAEKEDFDECYRYITDPSTFVQEWLENLMHSTIFHKENNSISEYAVIAKDRIRRIFEEIEKAIAAATDEFRQNSQISVKAWLKKFTRILESTVSISMYKFVHVSDKAVSDIKNFSQVVIGQIKDMEENARQHFYITDSSNIKWERNPVSMVFDNLWGCRETCPFCFEPCQYTDKYHVDTDEKHRCLQHRIKGLGGKYWKSKETLTLNYCNIDVQGNSVEFSVLRNNVKSYVPYRCYREEYPKWDIQPISETSDYWKWMLCKFQKQFEEKHGKRFEKIPSGWKKISKETALKSLEYYV